MKKKLFVMINVDFKIAGQLLIIYSTFIKYLGNNAKTMRQCIYLFIDCKKTYDSVRRGGLT
jgi:hypothetical protein